MQTLGISTVAAVALPFGLLALAAVVGNVIQHRLVWSAESLKPKLSKVSLGAGFKRLFSKIALANFVKGLIKLALIGTVMTVILWPKRRQLDGLVTMDPAAVLPLVKSMSLELLGTVIAILAIVAAADYLFQYRTWYNRQKMSLREMKEEFKQTEGDPAIKAKIRQLRQQRAKKRMMAEVPKASVIITNPTHYAVALQYDKGMNAPVCLAKGIDNLALKIREVAAAHNIPMVENPPLARALHATVEMDEEIPPEHYKAVAEVIGYVMRLRGAARA
jgi:flagellar biosynthetic protein FlhB